MKKMFPLFILTLYCIFCMVMTPTQASAYIDPSTTTFIIQAAVGLVVACTMYGFYSLFQRGRI